MKIIVLIYLLFLYTLTRTINENYFFGIKALLGSEKRTASIFAVEERVICYILKSRDFLSVLNEEHKKYLLEKLYLEDDEISLEDLDRKSVV